MKKKIFALILAAITAFTFCSCESVSEYPEGAPYDGIPELDGTSYSISYNGFNGKVKASLKWKPDDENWTATYTTDYYLEWQEDYSQPYSLVEPLSDKPKTNGKEYTLKPREKAKFEFKVKDYYPKLKNYGVYRFVKIIKVDENGKTNKYLVHFTLDFEDDE